MMKEIAVIPPRLLRKGWTEPASSQSVRCELVSVAEYERAHQAIGSVYFILNPQSLSLKIGHSRDPDRRRLQLQTGNSARLEIVGLLAAAREIETLAHEEFADLALEGEWFSDSALIVKWLTSLTSGQPVRSAKCTIEHRRPGWWVWNEETQTHKFLATEKGGE